MKLLIIITLTIILLFVIYYKCGPQHEHMTNTAQSTGYIYVWGSNSLGNINLSTKPGLPVIQNGNTLNGTLYSTPNPDIPLSDITLTLGTGGKITGQVASGDPHIQPASLTGTYELSGNYNDTEWTMNGSIEIPCRPFTCTLYFRGTGKV